MAAGDGLKSALDQAIEQVGVMRPKVASPDPQPDLLSDLQEEFARNVDLEVIEGAGARGRGRPKGSRSKTTLEWQAFIRANYGDPMVKLAQIAFGDPEVLRKSMGVKLEEVTARQQRAAEAMLPYFHQKMPQAIEVDKGVTILNLVVGQVANAPARPIDSQVVEVVENQSISDEVKSDV